MFTEEDLENLVPRKIFERGMTYYEDDAVGRIEHKGNTFKARVVGTDTYWVSLKVYASGPPEILCDCPYEHGEVCKHGIALGLAVLDLVGESPDELPPVPPDEARGRAHILEGAWNRTSDKEKLTFLRQLLVQKPKHLRRFLEAFEFDESLLAASAAVPQPRPARKAAPRRPLTLTEQAQQLLDQGRGADLLPLLLSVDWLQQYAAWDTPTLTYLLREAARFQPEATFDAVMERFEPALADLARRGWPLYNRLAACLQVLAQVPTLTRQVQLFASELMRQFGRLRSLHESLGRVGFALLEVEEDAGLRRARRKPRPAATEAATTLSRRGRPPKQAPRL